MTEVMGNAFTNTDFFDSNNNITKSVNESRDNERLSKDIMATFGIELLMKKTSWTNSINIEK
jgi:hypothetical protein